MRVGHREAWPTPSARRGENLPACRGRHPHLDHFDHECDEEARAVLLGATNSWFPITLSALAIPQSKDPLSQLVQDGWEFFEELESEAEVSFTVKTLKKTGALPGIDKYPAASIWSAIEVHRTGGGQEVVGEADIKGPEWDVLTEADPPTDYPEFHEQEGRHAAGLCKAHQQSVAPGATARGQCLAGLHSGGGARRNG